MQAIVTLPPYAPFIDEVLAHPVVSGIRLNTVMPTTGPIEGLLASLNQKATRYGKKLWVDLKCRQLRIANYGVPPFTEIELTHEIKVSTPVTAHFGNETATVLRVEGNKLIMLDGPRRVVGPGESVNIIHPSLRIDGYFTDRDKEYIKAGNNAGIDNYMLSFVESAEDTEALSKLVPDAKIVAKIESRKGLDYVKNDWSGESTLMAARGDLYIEVGMPHQIIEAVESIVNKDPNAIAASRILDSLEHSLEPSCQDIGDVDNLMRMGYKSLMLGDYVCLKRDPVMSALNLLEIMGIKY